MIIKQEGVCYTYNGITYTIGASVAATEVSAYRGLYGIITEIRDGADRETENDTSDFEPPVCPKEIEELEQRFSELYQTSKRLDEVVMQERQCKSRAAQNQFTAYLVVAIRNYKKSYLKKRAGIVCAEVSLEEYEEAVELSWQEDFLGRLPLSQQFYACKNG